MSDKIKSIKMGKSPKTGLRICLGLYKGQHSVWVESINYKLGRHVKTWCYIKLGLALEEAEKVFEERTTMSVMEYIKRNRAQIDRNVIRETPSWIIESDDDRRKWLWAHQWAVEMNQAGVSEKSIQYWCKKDKVIA